MLRSALLNSWACDPFLAHWDTLYLLDNLIVLQSSMSCCRSRHWVLVCSLWFLCLRLHSTHIVGVLSVNHVEGQRTLVLPTNMIELWIFESSRNLSYWPFSQNSEFSHCVWQHITWQKPINIRTIQPIKFLKSNMKCFHKTADMALYICLYI